MFSKSRTFGLTNRKKSNIVQCDKKELAKDIRKWTNMVVQVPLHGDFKPLYCPALGSNYVRTEYSHHQKRRIIIVRFYAVDMRYNDKLVRKLVMYV